MKKVISLIAVLSVLLIGCSELPETINEIPTDSNKRFNGVSGVNIVRDSETGCKYLYVEQGSVDSARIALSPLLKSDGTVDCTPEENKESFESIDEYQ